MSNYLLKPVFRSIFDREFHPNVFEDRLELQKAVYLLQNMGISVGDYGFCGISMVRIRKLYKMIY